MHLTRGLEYGIRVVDTSRLGLIANGTGTRIGDMDSLAMLSATQHGWLPGNQEREGVKTSERNRLKHDDLSILCKAYFLTSGCPQKLCDTLEEISIMST